MLRARPTPAVARLSALTGVRRPALAPAALRPAPLSSADRLASSFTGECGASGVGICRVWCCLLDARAHGLQKGSRPGATAQSVQHR